MAFAILAACAVASSIQLRYWKDSLTILGHTLVVIESKAPNAAGAVSDGQLNKSLRFIPHS
jgi:hypothetical protein